MAENNNNLMNNLEEVKETVEAGAKQVVEFAKDAKEKYDQAAPETQEKIKKGVELALQSIPKDIKDTLSIPYLYPSKYSNSNSNYNYNILLQERKTGDNSKPLKQTKAVENKKKLNQLIQEKLNDLQ